MHEIKDSVVLVSRRFDDFDELAIATRHWDIDFLQLDSGRFEGDVLQMQVGQVLLSEGRFGRTLKQQGAAPKAMQTFAVPAVSNVHFKWRRKNIGPDDLLAFPRSGELYAISQPDFHIFTISLPESLLHEVAEIADVPSLPQMLRCEKLPCPSPLMDLLREKLRDISRVAKKREDVRLLTRSAVLKELQFEIPMLLVRAMAAARTPAEVPAVRNREQVVKRAETYIAQFQAHPLSVRDVCRAAIVSERTLQYAFLGELGVTPRAYLKAVRLNGVRRELRRANSHVAKICEIAGGWGFWHMGQFAGDYRKHFGELPSQTLATAVE